ncbi:hypothetical protein [Paenibacillus sp. y28]|uniref:hypothetical protein n=1 Tax=Paenibacillus sp. y28 TaxID=3129110 RepID=UPI00301A0058
MESYPHSFKFGFVWIKYRPKAELLDGSGAVQDRPQAYWAAGSRGSHKRGGE